MLRKLVAVIEMAIEGAAWRAAGGEKMWLAWRVNSPVLCGHVLSRQEGTTDHTSLKELMLSRRLTWLFSRTFTSCSRQAAFGGEVVQQFGA